MCECCGKGCQTIIIETPDCGVFLHNGVLVAVDYTTGNIATEEKINFCPMCGRSLTDAQS